jgi:hypothetical protein
MSPQAAAEAVARYRQALGRFGGVKLSALSPSLFRLDPG